MISCLSNGQTTRPPLHPAGRSQHSAVFDPIKKMMLIFGGKMHYKNPDNASTSPDPRLWGWDGKEWTVVSENQPAWREDAKMAYDEKRGKAYMVGGRTYDSTGQPVVLDEFWEWDGSSWKERSFNFTPGKRLHANLVYDSDRDRLVLFGGALAGGGGFSNDLLEWDGSNWHRIESANAPTARLAHTMVYSRALKTTLIIGGVDQAGKPLTEIWAWDGKQFELLESNMPLVEPGAGNASTLDTKNEFKLLLCGRPVALADLKSVVSAAHTNQTWIWDGKQWSKLSSTANPSLREVHTIVYDQQNQKALLFGGSGRAESGHDNPADLWQFEKGTWSVASQPPSR